MRVALHEPGIACVGGFMKAVGVCWPAGFVVRVSGMAGAFSPTEDFEVRAGSLVTLCVRPLFLDVGASSSAGAGRRPCDLDDADDVLPEASERSWIRSVRPRRGATLGGMPSSGSGGLNVRSAFPDVCSRLDVLPACMVVGLDEAQCEVQRALRNAGLLCLQQQRIQSSLDPVQVVHNGLEAAFPEEDAQLPVAVDSDRDASQSTEPDIKRVRIKLVHFQGPERYEFLWTQQGEPVDGILARCEIIYNPDAARLRL